jgi:hypothetical protein
LIFSFSREEDLILIMIPAVVTKAVELEKPELTILKALAYFDIFNYPLTKEEIKNFSGCYVSGERVEAACFAKVGY